MSSWLFCLLAVVFLGRSCGGPTTDLNPDIADHELFWGADQYDFSIVVPAAGLECFWHFAHHGERFYLTFMVQWVTGVGHDRHLTVTVNSPSSLLVATKDDATGQINFIAEESGFYQMCFSNFHNRFGSMQIFLNFGVYYDGMVEIGKQKEEEKKIQEEINKDLNNTLSTIKETSHRVESYVFHMFRHYNFGRMRRSADYFILQSNSQYVTWWSAAQSTVIVLAGYLQLHFLKRLFNTKATTEAEKSMCFPTVTMRFYILLLVVLMGHGGRGQKSEPYFGQEDPSLFRGSDQYEFSIMVPGSGLECFWHFAHQSGTFYLSFMVQWVTGISRDYHLYVTVISPDGKLMASTNKAMGELNFQTEKTGFYKMCLGNHNNQFGDMRVFLNFGVQYEGFEEAKKEIEEDMKVLNSTISNIEISTKKLQDHIFHMWRHYSYARMRRGADHYLLLSNYNYVNWWSAAQSVVIVMAGYMQLLFLKRLFHTDTQRPRC
ncbi:uncharacterized protein tmed6 [Aplochiton taeniatus]